VRVDGSVGLVQSSGFFKQKIGTFPVASHLVNLSLESVKFKKRRRVLNSLVNKLQSLLEVSFESMVLGLVVENPQVDSGVLLFLVGLFQSSLFIH